MKAITYDRYGSHDVLEVREIAKPVPTDNEILIRVKAAEATKSDCELRSFRFPVLWFWLPLRLAFGVTKPRRRVLGGYFAGVVEAVGKAVVKFEPGQEVFGATGLGMGAYGEYVSLPEGATVVEKPTNMTFVQAAAVPLGGLNAIHFMKLANVREGEHVLVNGAGGSIGTFGVQIAKAQGAEVTAVDSAIKKDLLTGIGADHFIDYAEEDFTESERKYDVIFDMVAGSSHSACLSALNPGGRYLSGNPRVSKMLRAIFANWFSDKKSIFAFAAEDEAELLELKEMIEAGQITSTVDRVYSMENAGAAHHRVETEQRVGIVVISLSQ